MISYINLMLIMKHNIIILECLEHMCQEEIINESQAGFIMLSDGISCAHSAAHLHASSGS